MARTLYSLTPLSAELPSSNAPALLQDAQSRWYLAFDSSTDETCYWTVAVPQGIENAISALVTYRTSATSGTAAFEVAVEALSDGDSVDTDSTASFDSVNTASAVTVPGTGGYIDQVSITLTNNDSMAASDYCRIRLNRDTSADNAAADIEVLLVELIEA